MASFSTNLIALQEGDVTTIASESFRIMRLSNGSLAAVPELLELSEEQRDLLLQEAAQTGGQGAAVNNAGSNSNPQLEERHFFGVPEVLRDVEFACDPCSLNHICIPLKWANEKGKRTLYSKCQQWRGDVRFAEAVPKQEYLKLLMDVKKSPFLSEEDKAATLVFLHDYEDLRRTVSLRAHEDRSVTMANVPDTLALNPDGSRFLHFHTPEMQIYYVEEVLRVNVPLLYALTSKKTERAYVTIWSTLKDARQTVQCLTGFELCSTSNEQPLKQ
ncbi:unnamed protein product [Heligmosomoides polygyrus]|uniref:Ras-associating domain-containing protein n=1 Tax=Heligmosomoides polygyrus TaxID=6339 RepID=A0A183GBG0_HELPZ|nr:unnamed protein product [Heligmosomoides polygyrus]